MLALSHLPPQREGSSKLLVFFSSWQMKGTGVVELAGHWYISAPSEEVLNFYITTCECIWGAGRLQSTVWFSLCRCFYICWKRASFRGGRIPFKLPLRNTQKGAEAWQLSRSCCALVPGRMLVCPKEQHVAWSKIWKPCYTPIGRTLEFTALV